MAELSLLLPAGYVVTIFVVTKLFKLLLKVPTAKSENFKSIEVKEIEEKLTELSKELEGLNPTSQLVQVSKIQREMNKLRLKRELLLKEQNILNIDQNPNDQPIKKLISTLSENSLAIGIIFYLFFRKVEIYLGVEGSMFDPISGLLGFGPGLYAETFTISLLFVFLVCRYLNRLTHLFDLE